jgi:glycosyltransferase involved in cell wall biosynthesis
MKILIATDNYYPNVNGASYFAQRLAYYLKKHYHSVLVIAPSLNHYEETSQYDGVQVYGVPSMPLERIRVPFPIMVALYVEKAINQFQPDVIHIQSHFAIGRNAANTAKSLHIPIVGTNHFMPENLVHYFHPPKPIETMVINMGWAYCLKTLNRLDAVTSPTKIAAGLLEKVGIKKPVSVISNGIDLQIFKPSNDGAYLATRYKIPTDKPVLLFVGRLDKEKYLDLVIRALAKAISQTPITLIIVGTGAERSKLEKLAADLHLQLHIIFTGFVPDEDLPNLYTLADCFIMAGTVELQSIATMEAMASGLPVLAVRAMALPELVRDGENGFLFEHGNISQMAEQIVRLLGNQSLRQKMGQTSLQIIQSHNIDRVIEKFEALYQEIAKRKS